MSEKQPKIKNIELSFEVVKKFDPKKLLFVCLKKDLNKDSRKKGNCYYAVFNEIGEYIEVVFQHKSKDSGITVDKVVSPFYSTNRDKLQDALNLSDENFMSLSEAYKRKYFVSRENPIKLYKKCHCLKFENSIVNPDNCDANGCINPEKVYIIEDASYSKGRKKRISEEEMSKLSDLNFTEEELEEEK